MFQKAEEKGAQDSKDRPLSWWFFIRRPYTLSLLGGSLTGLEVLFTTAAQGPVLQSSQITIREGFHLFKIFKGSQVLQIHT